MVDRSHEAQHIPARPTQAINTTGADDMRITALLTYLARGISSYHVSAKRHA